MFAKKNAVLSMNPSGPQPLADEDLGTVAGGHGHCRKRRRYTTGYGRKTSRWGRKSHCGRRTSKFFSRY